MFICIECLKKYYENDPDSFHKELIGHCESCGKNDVVCKDVPYSSAILRTKTPSKKKAFRNKIKFSNKPQRKRPQSHIQKMLSLADAAFARVEKPQNHISFGQGFYKGFELGYSQAIAKKEKSNRVKNAIKYLKEIRKSKKQ